MGIVMDLNFLRGYRRDQHADRALAMSMHPALRFTAGDDMSTGHRRTPLGRAVCGAVGELRVADAARDAELCPVCFPDLVGSG